MRGRLLWAIAWLAYKAGLNLNYVFSPFYTWRLRPRQPLLMRNWRR